MDTLGKRLLKAITSEQTLEPLKQFGITEHDVFDEARQPFKWVLDFWERNGSVPSTKQVEENTGISLPDDTDELRYICDLVRQRTLGKRLESNFKQAIGLLEQRDPDKALDLISSFVSGQFPHSQLVPKSFRDGGLDRYARYEDAQRAGGLFGIPTPWPSLNSMIQGWVNKTLNVVIAVQNTGKSWFACIAANDAFSKGKKVLLVSMEMPNQSIERRVDSLHYKLPFEELRNAEVDLFSLIRWKGELTANTKGNGDIIFADKNLVKYVEDVIILVERYSPDIVIIDGGYRFTAKSVQGDWESAKTIVAQLQTAAEKTDIPWIVTTQQGDAGTESTRDRQQRAFKVKYAKEWVIHPDNVIEMYQNEDYLLLKQMKWKQLKERESVGKFSNNEFLTSWDLENMDFTEIPMDAIRQEQKAITY